MTMTTYKRVDGEPVAGEYGWVVDFEFFDDERQYADEPFDVVREVWTLSEAEVITVKPTHWVDDPCAFCGDSLGDHTLDEKDECADAGEQRRKQSPVVGGPEGGPTDG